MPASLPSRIADIIKLSGGSRREAERLMREAIARDPAFLRELVDPFLPGIIAHALGRELGGAEKPAAKAPKPISESGMDALMRGLQDRAAAPTQPQAVKSGHADTIRALAEAQRRKRTT